MVVLHAVGPEPGGGALRATLRVTQTPIVHPRASTRAKLRGMTISAQSARSILDNFAHAERSSPAANAREASRTLLRSWHTRRLLQRLAPREQCSASAKDFAHGMSQRRRRLCALRWVAPRLLRRGISTALRAGAVAARREFLISSGFRAMAQADDKRMATPGTRVATLRVISIREHPPFRLCITFQMHTCTVMYF